MTFLFGARREVPASGGSSRHGGAGLGQGLLRGAGVEEQLSLALRGCGDMLVVFSHVGVRGCGSGVAARSVADLEDPGYVSAARAPGERDGLAGGQAVALIEAAWTAAEAAEAEDLAGVLGTGRCEATGSRPLEVSVVCEGFAGYLAGSWDDGTMFSFPAHPWR